MHSKFRRELDPLDLELVARAFEDAWLTVKESHLGADEELEATLRRELIEIALSNGVKDAGTLRHDARH